jgi:hypothetical protein
MPLKVVLHCDNSFRTKAQYTFEMLALMIGETVQIVGKEECKSSDIVLCYGRREDDRRFPGRHVVITGSEEAWKLFDLKERYIHHLARQYTIDGEPSLALFYDREFFENPELIIEKKGREIFIHIDIIASAFFFLSGWQEWRPMDTDIHRRFPFESSIQYAFGVLGQPIVDQYGLIVKNAVEKAGWQGPKTGRYREKSFAVMMTHDIDHTRKWTPGIIYRECVRHLILNRRNDFIKDRILRFGHFLRMLIARHDPYRISVDKILSAEEKMGVHATFFIKAGGNNKRDVSYSLRNVYIRRLLRILKNRGHQIGLHPSYNAYSHTEMMEKEQKTLEAAMGESPGAVREHFLRFEMPLTWKIQNELGFEYDSTLGFPGHEGFRMATCHPFRAYDLEHDRPLHLWELPLIAMDDTFVSYRKLDPLASWKSIRDLLETVKKYHGIAVLLFHNSCYDDFDNQGWGSIFEKTLRWSFENNAALLNGQEALESYRKTAMPHTIREGTRLE